MSQNSASSAIDLNLGILLIFLVMCLFPFAATTIASCNDVITAQLFAKDYRYKSITFGFPYEQISISICFVDIGVSQASFFDFFYCDTMFGNVRGIKLIPDKFGEFKFHVTQCTTKCDVLSSRYVKGRPWQRQLFVNWCSSYLLTITTFCQI